MMIKQLSQILIDNFGVSNEDVTDAQRVSTETGESIGDILTQGKIISESQRLEALSMQYNLPFQPDLPIDNIGINFAQQVPIQFLRKYVMVPLKNTPPATRSDNGSPEDEPALFQKSRSSRCTPWRVR